MEKVRQREIKFRCFYNGKMYPVLELHGEDSMTVNGIKMHLDGLGERIVSPDSEHIEGVMQWTGLKDKNGKDIYEGDVCWTYEHGIGNLNRVVEFRYGSFVLTHELMLSEELRGFKTDYMEVIGNIFEHPHLLSQGEIKTELI